MDQLKPEVASLCEEFGPQVEGDLKGAALLGAIAIVESTGGHNNYPNFEPYWVPEGTAFTIEGKVQRGRHPASNAIVRKRYEAHGMAAGCSFSAWQLLYHTAADRGYDGKPWALWNNTLAVKWVVKQLNRIHEKGATTLEQVADAWNSGTHRDKIIPAAYIAKVQRAYDGLTGENEA